MSNLSICETKEPIIKNTFTYSNGKDTFLVKQHYCTEIGSVQYVGINLIDERQQLICSVDLGLYVNKPYPNSRVDTIGKFQLNINGSWLFRSFLDESVILVEETDILKAEAELIKTLLKTKVLILR